MSELKEFKLDKFTFHEAAWRGFPVRMEWNEDSIPDTDYDIDINRADAEKLITFLADSLNISLRDLAHRNGR